MVRNAAMINRNVILVFAASTILILFNYPLGVFACVRTSSIGDHFTTESPASTSSETSSTVTSLTTTPSIGTTKGSASTKATQTTTTSKICPSAAPLFRTGIPTAGNQRVDFVPAATASVGSTISANCVVGSVPFTGTIVFVNYDSGGPTQRQDANNFPFPGNNEEQIYLTCTPSLEWNVLIRTTTGPVSGIVSTPGGILCII